MNKRKCRASFKSSECSYPENTNHHRKSPLTFVVLERVPQNLAVRAFVQSQAGVPIAVRVVFPDNSAVAGAVEHDPVLPVVEDLR